MPSVSKSQRRFFGMVHAYKQGKLKKAYPQVKKSSRSVSAVDALEYARRSVKKKNKNPFQKRKKRDWAYASSRKNLARSLM